IPQVVLRTPGEADGFPRANCGDRWFFGEGHNWCDQVDVDLKLRRQFGVWATRRELTIPGAVNGFHNEAQFSNRARGTAYHHRKVRINGVNPTWLIAWVGGVRIEETIVPDGRPSAADLCALRVIPQHQIGKS